MSKHGQEYNENLTQKEMFEMGRKYEREQMARHSEVEGLVEEFRAKFYAIQAVWSEEKKAYEYPISEMMDWLRTAFTTHSAKERASGIQIAQKLHMEVSTLELSPEETLGYVKALADVIEHTLATPQTDVTKN